MSTQNDNPNDGWQLSAASEKASPSGRGNAILLMSHGDEARGGSASRRCKFHLWNRARPEKDAREAEIRFPPTVYLSFLPRPESRVTSLMQEGTCFLQQEEGSLGAALVKDHSLLSFYRPLRTCHICNVLSINYIDVTVLLLYITLYSNDKVRERIREEIRPLLYPGMWRCCQRPRELGEFIPPRMSVTFVMPHSRQQQASGMAQEYMHVAGIKARTWLSKAVLDSRI